MLNSVPKKSALMVRHSPPQVPRLRMSAALPSLPAHAFMSCTGATSHFLCRGNITGTPAVQADWRAVPWLTVLTETLPTALSSDQTVQSDSVITMSHQTSAQLDVRGTVLRFLEGAKY